MNNVKIIEIKKEFKVLGLYLQLFLIVLLVIFGIITIFFNKEFLTVVYFILTAIMLLMAWNNRQIYKHKHMSLIYLLFALLTLISGIMELL